MNKSWIVVLSVFGSPVGPSVGELFEDPGYPPKTLKMRIEQTQHALDRVQQYVDEKMIQDLREGDFEGVREVLKVADGGRPRFIAGQEEQASRIRQATISALREYPGYAESIQEKLDVARDAFREGELDASSYVWTVGTELKYFDDLTLHGTVTVLGSYLDDRSKDVPRLSNGLQPPDREFSTAEFAVRALGGLPLKNPPEPIDGSVYRAAPELMIDRWIEWWAEVEAGERTFQFTDHSTIYSAEGVVGQARATAPDQPRPAFADRVAGIRREAVPDGSSEGVTRVFLLGGVALAAVALGWWYVRRGSKKGIR